MTGCRDAAAGYPSLAPRPIEDLSLTEPMRPAPPPAVASPEATARYAPIVQQARDADAAFRRAYEQEHATLERGLHTPTGSEEWTAAQESLSRIEAARSPVARALADLDAARDSAPTATNTGEAISASEAYEQVHQIDQAEVEMLTGAQPPAP
jgi:hypothetical protein